MSTPKSMFEKRKHRSERNPLPSAEELCALFAYDAASGILSTKLTTKMRLAGAPVGHRTPAGYLRTDLPTGRFFVHRIIWKMVTGNEPPSVIDHKDGNRLNNRFANLREATDQTNAQNMSGHSTTGVKGVSRSSKNTFRVQIRANGQNITIGKYRSIDAAAEAYAQAAVLYFGEFARFGSAA